MAHAWKGVALAGLVGALGLAGCEEREVREEGLYEQEDVGIGGTGREGVDIGENPGVINDGEGPIEEREGVFEENEGLGEDEGL